MNTSSPQLRSILALPNEEALLGMKKFLQENDDTLHQCEPFMLEKIGSIMKQVLQAPILSENAMLDIQVILQVIQQLSHFKDSDSQQEMLLMLDKGFMNMIKLFVTTLHYLRGSVSEPAEKLYEEILETIEAVANSSPAARGIIVDTFCDRLLQIVVSKNFGFTTRLETLKGVNVLMDRCPMQSRDKLKSSRSHKELMYALAVSMQEAGDYEFQVGLAECLFRLTSKADRARLAKTWFEAEELFHAFLDIKDSDFETDCRGFLVLMNSVGPDIASVISLPCKSAYLGPVELQKPNDVNYSKFWIDFNTGSKRMSLFCEPQLTNSQAQEEDSEVLWETVSAWDDTLVQWNIQEKPSPTRCLAVTLKLKFNVRELITFGPRFDSRIITLNFEVTPDVETALIRTFGMDKMAPKRKTSMAVRPIKLNDPSKDHLSPAQLKVKSTHEAVKKGTQHLGSRPKVSVPSVPMRPTFKCAPPTTPSAKRNAQPPKTPQTPKTPQGQSQKKVKTPLQFVDTRSYGSESSPRPASVARDVPVASGVDASEVATTTTKGAQSKNVMAASTTEACLPETSQQGRSKAGKKKSVKNKIGKNKATVLSGGPTAAVNSMDDSSLVVPSSAPEGFEVVPDSQPMAVDTIYPALSGFTNTTKMSRKTVSDDSGVCLDTTNDVIQSKLSKPDEGRLEKKNKMAGLRQKLQTTDPDFGDFPANTNKVSSTPCLSTVSEESAAGGNRLNTESNFRIEILTTEEPETERLSQAEKRAGDRQYKSSGSLDSVVTANTTAPSLTSKGRRGKKAAKDPIVTKASSRARTRSRAAAAAAARNKPPEAVDVDRHVAGDVSRDLVCSVSRVQRTPDSDTQNMNGNEVNDLAEPSEKLKLNNSDVCVRDEEKTDLIDGSVRGSYEEKDHMRDRKVRGKHEKDSMKDKNAHGPQEEKAKLKHRKMRGKHEDLEDMTSGGQKQEKADIENRKVRGQNKEKANSKERNMREQHDENVNLDEAKRQEENAIVKDADLLEIHEDLVELDDDCDIVPPSADLFASDDKQTDSRPPPDGPDRSLVCESEPNWSDDDGFELIIEESFEVGAKKHNTAQNVVQKSLQVSPHQELLITSEPGDIPDKTACREGKNEALITGNEETEHQRLEHDKLRKPGSVKNGQRQRNKKKETCQEADHTDQTTLNLPKRKKIDAKETINSLESNQNPRVKKLKFFKSRMQQIPCASVSTPDIHIYDFEREQELLARTSRTLDAMKAPKRRPSSTQHESEFGEASPESESVSQSNISPETVRNAITRGKANTGRATQGKKKRTDALKNGVQTDNEHIYTKGALEADVSSNINETTGCFEHIMKEFQSLSATRPKTRPKTCIDYHEQSDNELDSRLDVSVAEEAQTQAPTVNGRDKFQASINTAKSGAKISKKKKHYIFSETDDAGDSRSEVSWLASTARKKKPRLEHDYTHNRKFFTGLGRLAASREALYSDDREGTNREKTRKAPKKTNKKAQPKKRKKKACDAPVDVTLGEDSGMGNLYFNLFNSGGDANKENQPPNQVVHPSLGKLSRLHHSCGSRTSNETTPLSDVTNKSASRVRRDDYGVRLPITSATDIDADRSIERFRGPDIVESTPNFLMSSSMGRLDQEGLISVHTDLRAELLPEDRDLDRLSGCTHISEVKTPKTPRYPGRTDIEEENMEEEEEEALCQALKSGPYKRKKSTAPSFNLDLSSFLDGVVEDEVMEEQTDSNEEDASFRPRRLFAGFTQAAAVCTTPGLAAVSDVCSSPERDELNSDLDEYEPLPPRTREDAEDPGVCGLPQDPRVCGLPEDPRVCGLPQDPRVCGLPEELMADTLGIQTGISSLLKSFGSEFQNNMQAKKNHLDKIAQNMTRSTQKQLKRIWQDQHQHRLLAMEEFKDTITKEIKYFELDVSHINEAEDSILSFCNEQHQVIMKHRKSQEKRLQRMSVLHQSLKKVLCNPSQHVQTQTRTKEILRREMEGLEKRLLHQTQSEEMKNVKKSLASLFL